MLTWLYQCRSNNEGELTTQLHNNKALKRIDSYKYLGTWIEENGTCNRNIEKKKEKCEMILPKVLQMASREAVGNLATIIRIIISHHNNTDTIIQYRSVGKDYQKKHGSNGIHPSQNTEKTSAATQNNVISLNAIRNRNMANKRCHFV